MRDEKRWPKMRESFCQKHFTPRLCQDLAVLTSAVPYNSLSPSMYIYGPTGTGKTVTAAFLAVDWYRGLWMDGASGDKTFKFLSAPDLLLQIKATFGRPGVSEYSVLRGYMEVDLLVLDDLGTGHTAESNWALGILYVLINYRYEHLKQTIITSNVPLEELADVFGDERITSRIERMCKIVEKEPTWKVNT